MSKKIPPWIEQATNPTGTEIARLVQPIDPDFVQAAAEGTSPMDSEINRLLMSRASAVVAEPSAWDWIGVQPRQLALAGIAAAALLTAGLTGVMPQSYGPVGSPLGEIAEWNGSFELGPSIDVTADGILRVAQADRQDTVIDLIDGTAEFSVDPGGLYRHLLIRADDVEVEVKGTVFDVTVDDGQVWVNTTRGKVAVRYQGIESFVTADSGEWSTASIALQHVSAEPPALVPPVGIVVDTPVAARERIGVVATVSDVPMAAEAEGTDAETEAAATPRRRSSAADFVTPDRMMRRGENPEVMLGMWDEFLENHPDSVEAPEARLNRLKALAGLAPNKSTMREITVFTAITPEERTDLLEEAHLLQVGIGQELLDDCGSVTGSYHWLISHGDNKTTAMASAWLGLCGATDKEQALNALDRALALGLEDPALEARVREVYTVKEGSRATKGKRR